MNTPNSKSTKSASRLIDEIRKADERSLYIETPGFDIDDIDDIDYTRDEWDGDEYEGEAWDW